MGDALCAEDSLPDSCSSNNSFPNSPPRPSGPCDHARRRKWLGELPGPSWSCDNSDSTIQGNPTWQLGDKGWTDISGNKGSVFPGRGS